MFPMKLLSQLKVGEQGTVVAVNGEGAVRRRLFDMGITPGAEVYLRKKAPLGDPIEIAIRGYELTLRKAEAAHVEIR
jgi:Fe2+ transport system protein FeoA